MMYRVIIVEDDPMVASINRQYVESVPDFQVKGSFKCGSDALDYLEKADVDLVILDYYTPLMNGGQFLDRLRAMGKTPSVIMVTSANDTEIVRSLLVRGVMDYLVKPFEYDRFQGALEKFKNTQMLLGTGKDTFSQEEIDRLTAAGSTGAAMGAGLPKGLNETTLATIGAFLREHSCDLLSSEQIAEGVGLSRITVRRYVSYLVDTGELGSAIDYQTGGRPSIKYRLQGKGEGSL